MGSWMWLEAAQIIPLGASEMRQGFRTKAVDVRIPKAVSEPKTWKSRGRRSAGSRS